VREQQQEANVQQAIFRLSIDEDVDEKIWKDAAEWQAELPENMPNSVEYLRIFGYNAVSDTSWASDSGSLDRPTICFRLNHHVEKGGYATTWEQHFCHTWYIVECSLDLKRPQGQFLWQAPRRLTQLRVGLHDPLKDAMSRNCGNYVDHFAETPFAKHGGIPGTTSRLQQWLGSLGKFLNGNDCIPAVLALTLCFFKAHMAIRRPALQLPADPLQLDDSDLDMTCAPGDEVMPFTPEDESIA
jgi:hypothetical protein